MRPRKVLYLEQNTDGTVGGSYYALLELLRRLDRSRFEPLVVFYDENLLIADFRATGADVRVLKPERPFRFRDHFRGLPQWVIKALLPLQRTVNLFATLLLPALRWRRLLRAERVDLVHINNSVATSHGLMLAAQLTGVPCLVHQRGLLERRCTFTARFFARRLCAIVSISTAVTENLRRSGVSLHRVALVHDGLDSTRLEIEQPAHELRRRLAIPAAAPVIGVVGNIKEWKGQDVVVRAAAKVRARYPQLRCLIVGAVGAPGYMRKLERLCEELGLGNVVIFTGFEKNVADYMNVMDVVVHSSVKPEPFGIVLLEAMALERALVAADLGGPREIVIDGESGRLVPAGDVDALAATLEELLGDAEQRAQMGTYARERVHAAFSMQATAERIQALYQRVVSADGGQQESPVEAFS